MRKAILLGLVLLGVPFSASAKRVNGSEVDDYTLYFDKKTQTWTIYEMVEKAKLQEDDGVGLSGPKVKELFLNGQIEVSHLDDLRVIQFVPYLKIERVFFTDTISLVENKIVKTGTKKEILSLGESSTAAKVSVVVVNIIFIALPLLWLAYAFWVCRKKFWNKFNLDNCLLTTTILFIFLLSVGPALYYFCNTPAFNTRVLSAVVGVVLGVFCVRDLGHDALRAIIGMSVALMGAMAIKSGLSASYARIILSGAVTLLIAQQVWRLYIAKKEKA